MKKLGISIAIILLSHNIFCQDIEISATLYRTSEEFINNDSINLNALIIVKEKSPQHLWVRRIVDANTKKKIDKDVSIWALKYDNRFFFNLGYSNDLNNWRVYVRLDVVGKYCAAFINSDSPNIVKNGGGNYGGGMQGFLTSESTKWNKSWNDSIGKKQRILFINTSKIVPGYASRNSSSLGNYLTVQELKEISPDSFKTNDDLNFEQLVEIITGLNEANIQSKSAL